jgi:hypothetical protein
MNKNRQNLKQQIQLVVLGLTFGNFPHLSRRGLTSFERRFLKEFKESFHVLGKNEFFSFAFFLVFNSLDLSWSSVRTCVCLHAPPHVEKLADVLFFFPISIFLQAHVKTIHGGMALSVSAVQYSTVQYSTVQYYWSWIVVTVSGDATALQTMQLFMVAIAIGVE